MVGNARCVQNRGISYVLTEILPCKDKVYLSFALPIWMVPCMDPSLFEKSVCNVEFIKRTEISETHTSIIASIDSMFTYTAWVGTMEVANSGVEVTHNK